MSVATDGHSAAAEYQLSNCNLTSNSPEPGDIRARALTRQKDAEIWQVET